MPTALYESVLHTSQISQQRWLSQEVFSFQWFVLVASLLAIYAIWIKLLDKKRLRELLLFGSLTAVSAVFVDLIATSRGYWEYLIRVLPIYPATFPFDFTVLPITFMIALQYTTSWKGYTMASLINSAVFAFVVSPLFVSLGIKAYHNFNYIYMFLLAFIQMMATKAVYNWIVSIEVAGYTKEASSTAVGLQPALAKPLPNLDDKENKK